MGDLGTWSKEALVRFSMRMAKVLSEPLRLKILEELNRRDMSPKQFYEEYGGGSLTRVWRHFRILEEYEWIEKVAQKSGGMRRGATENFYRATGPAAFFGETWTALPQTMKEKVSATILETIVAQVLEAMRAGAFDARSDRHFTSTPLLLDEQGWSNVIARVDGLFEFLFEEVGEARARLAESGEEPIPVIVALAAFESPQETVRPL